MAKTETLDQILSTTRRQEDRPVQRAAQAEQVAEAPPETGGGGGGSNFLMKLLKAAIPVAGAALAPDGAGAQGFVQGFQGQMTEQQRLRELGMEQEARREAARRDNAVLVWEAFQNNPQSFQALTPDQLMPIVEIASEQFGIPKEQMIQVMQAQAQEAAGPSAGQNMNLIGTLANSNPEAAGQIAEANPELGLEGVDFGARQAEPSKPVDTDDVARILSTFTEDSGKKYFAELQQGGSPAEASRHLVYRDNAAARGQLESDATIAANMMHRGETPDPIRMQAFNKYYGVKPNGLSNATIASIVTSTQQLATFMLSIDPDNPENIKMFNNAADVAKRLKEEIEKLMADGHQLSPEQLQAYVDSRGTRLLQGEGGEPAPDPKIEEANAAFIDKAEAELGPDATEEEVVARAKELRDGDGD